MIKPETGMEQALREESAILDMIAYYKVGKVISVTKESTEEYVKYAGKKLKELKRIINDPKMITEHKHVREPSSAHNGRKNIAISIKLKERKENRINSKAS